MTTGVFVVSIMVSEGDIELETGCFGPFTESEAEVFADRFHVIAPNSTKCIKELDNGFDLVADQCHYQPQGANNDTSRTN